MLTYLKVALLFVMFAGSTPLWVAPLLVPAGESRVQVDAPEKIDPAQLVAVVESEKFRLVYPVVFEQEVSLREIILRLLEAYDRVETEFGAFEHPVDVYIPYQIPNADAAEHHLVIAGLTYVHEGRVQVLVALWAAHDVDTFAHELLHARLRDAGISPPAWFEEGLAHFIESKDGFNETLYQLLLEKGPINLKKAASIEGITENEMQLRATAWLLTYYLHRYEGKTLGEIAAAKTFPNPVTALERVRKDRAGVVSPRTK